MNKTLGTDFTGKNTVSWRSTILSTSLQSLGRRLYTAGSVGSITMKIAADRLGGSNMGLSHVFRKEK